MTPLGYVLWWTVKDPSITDAELRDLVVEWLPNVTPPNVILPQDAFRRLTGNGAADHYTDSDDGVRRTLSLQEVTSPKATMNRAILLTRTKDGVQQSVARVGDVVFYKPPRNEWSKARIRFTPVPGLREADATLFRLYTDGLRREYDRALHHVNGQAVRRLVRSYLKTVDSIPLDGPYFLYHRDDAERLRGFLDTIGQASCTYVTIPDDRWHRDIVEAAATRIRGETHG